MANQTLSQYFSEEEQIEVQKIMGIKTEQKQAQSRQKCPDCGMIILQNTVCQYCGNK